MLPRYDCVVPEKHFSYRAVVPLLLNTRCLMLSN